MTSAQARLPARSFAVASLMRVGMGRSIFYGLICVASTLLGQDSLRGGSAKPEILGLFRGYAPLVLADGTVEHYYTVGDSGKQTVVRMRSLDEGVTWTAPKIVFSLPAEGTWAGRSPHPMMDRSGNLHLFLLDVKPAGHRFWHTYLRANEVRWTQPQPVGPGGPQTPPIQLQSGRIVVPTGYLVGESRWDAPFGRRAVGVFHSDDSGATWIRSPHSLRVRGFTDQTTHTGAHEPIVSELADGQVWMLIRNQTGWLYESRSADGNAWSEPQPTDFRSSDSPASVVRLPKGEIVVFWNNCREPPPKNGAWIYTGRDALHAAISNDDGRTWSGFREVYLDDRRDQVPPRNGDRGTAYPNAAVTKTGRILVATGQADNRKLVRLDPNWLLAEQHSDDFSRGLGGWSVFKSFGPVEKVWRNRKPGARLVSNPTVTSGTCLQLRRPDPEPGDGATWNFPAGKLGRISFQLYLEPGFQGAHIALTDQHFFPEEVAIPQKVFTWTLPASRKVADGEELEPARWHRVELTWQTEHRGPSARWPGTCQIHINGREVETLPQLYRAKAGLSYVRFNDIGSAVSPSGFLVANIEVKIEKSMRPNSAGGPGAGPNSSQVPIRVSN